MKTLLYLTIIALLFSCSTSKKTKKSNNKPINVQEKLTNKSTLEGTYYSNGVAAPMKLSFYTIKQTNEDTIQLLFVDQWGSGIGAVIECYKDTFVVSHIRSPRDRTPRFMLDSADTNLKSSIVVPAKTANVTFKEKPTKDNPTSGTIDFESKEYYSKTADVNSKTLIRYRFTLKGDFSFQ